MSNNSSNWGDSSTEVSDHPFIVDYHPILIACSVMICIPNCFVIMLFLTQASLRSTGNHLLFSLAISDLSVGILGIPVNIACELTVIWDACLSAYSVNRFIAVSTVYHILWITLEKYTAIIYPLRHKSQFDQRKVRCICLGTWFCSVLLSVVELSWLTQHDDPYTDYSEDIERKEITYNIFIFAGVFVFPMAVMIFAYTSIFFRILRHHSNEFLRKHMYGKERSTHVRIPRNVKSALLFFVILVVFVLGWFWWFFAVIYYNIFKNAEDLVSQKVLKTVTALRYSTSFVNPILYTFFKRDFNKALKKFTNRSRLVPVRE